MKKISKLVALLSAFVLTFGTTAFAGTGDTYSDDPDLKGTNEYYESVTYNFHSLVVDHYHGDQVSVVLYEFRQNDISNMGKTSYFPFYCVDGKAYRYSQSRTPELETKFPLVFKYQSIDAEEVANIDGNSINVWEFSIKPGTYAFAGGWTGTTMDEYYQTLCPNVYEDLPHGVFDDPEEMREAIEMAKSLGMDPEANGLTMDNFYPTDYYVELEAGDTIYLYTFFTSYVPNDKVGEKIDNWYAQFQDWAAENEKNRAQLKEQSADPGEVIEVTQESSEEPSITESTSAETQTQSSVPEESKPVIQPSTEVVEEKKSPVGALIGGGIVLIILLVIGIWATKKK